MKKVLFVNEASHLNTGYAVYGRNVMSYLYNTGKYEIHELAVYGEENDPKLHNVPWKVYPNVPSKPADKQKYDSNPSFQFGAWRFDRLLSDIQPTHVCFKPNALVMTDHGYKEISSLKIGDMVLTHKNRFMPITNVMRREYKGDMVHIYMNGMSNALILTPDHPVLVNGAKRQTNQKKGAILLYKEEDPKFIPAKNIKKGDKVILPSWESGEESRIDITTYLDNYISIDNDKITNHAKTYIVNRYINIDYDFGKLCGYVIGDGHITGGETQFNYKKDRGPTGLNIFFGVHEKHFAEDAALLINKIFGIIPKVEISDLGNMWVCTIYSSIVAKVLSSLIGHRYWNKKVPKEIITGSNESKLGLIEGLIRSDGWATKKNVSFCCYSKSLAYTYRAICNSLGICTLMNDKPKYTVSAYGYNGLLLDNIAKKYKKFLPKKNIKRDTSRVKFLENKRHAITSVSRVRNYPYEGLVYNISVEEDESYVLESCVHNCVFRDYWMDSFIRTSPYRKYFNWIWMPACDGAPQEAEWINAFSNAEHLLSYSDWGVETLKSHGLTNVLGSASPSANEAFRPIPNQIQHKTKYGFENHKIIGFVSRNQRRKLYPDLFLAFAQYIRETADNHTFLLCHTSYPDNGWDFPKFLLEHNIQNRVLFTYICSSCQTPSITHFNGTVQFCQNCKQMACTMPNVKNGYSDEQLADVYNLMDLYIQWANSEGAGIGQLEAAACGTPIANVDYSAMSDIGRKLNGWPIKPLTYYNELETGCYRAIPNNRSLIELLKQWLPIPYELKFRKRLETRALYEQHYGWEKAAKQWEKAIDLCEPKDWDTPGNLLHVPDFNQIKDIPLNNDFVTVLLETMWPEMLGTYTHISLSRDLDNQFAKVGATGYFNTDHTLGFKHQPFNREIAYNLIKTKCEENNFWERVRIKDIVLPKEDWL